MSLSLKSNITVKHAMCRLVAKMCFGLGVLSLAGCMSSVGPTVQATKQIGGYSVAALQELDLSDEVLADAMSIQHAVSGVKPFNVDTLALADNSNMSPLFWSNNVTGSQGEVSYLSEKASGNGVCKHFKSTRLSFEGIASYKGVSCKTSNGGWKLYSFFPVI